MGGNVDLCQPWSSLSSGPGPRWALTSPTLTLSYAEVRSRASIAVAPFNYDSPYLGTSHSLPADPASCSVLGSLNLHLYRDPALQGLRWPLYSTSFPEEPALETEVELGSQPSLSRSGLSQGQEGMTWGLGRPCSQLTHSPFLAPEDSEVSSQCPSASGSSGSDSSYVSGQALGKVLEDLSYVSPISLNILQRLPSPVWA